jgi:hypothetical protein
MVTRTTQLYDRRRDEVNLDEVQQMAMGEAESRYARPIAASRPPPRPTRCRRSGRASSSGPSTELILSNPPGGFGPQPLARLSTPARPWTGQIAFWGLSSACLGASQQIGLSSMVTRSRSLYRPGANGPVMSSATDDTDAGRGAQIVSH